ncbi:MAG: signal peptidase I [Candidatus Saccharibacteria bacterium]|nr:signal peptidase I [Candidatus Saccharibacteria bacterium]
MAKTWKIVKIFFYIAIIVSAIFIIITSINIFGFQSFIVKSGSMEPKIHTGSVVVDHSSTNYQTSDVITFKVTGTKDTVTHRIVKVNQKSGITSYRVKGDANATPDPDPVLKTNVVGRVLFSVPFLGYLISFIRSIPGLIIFIAIPTLIIISEEIGNIKTEVKKIANRNKDINKKVAELAKKESELEAREQKIREVIKKIQEKTNNNPKL